VIRHRRAGPVATATVAKDERGLRQHILEVAFIWRVRRRLPADGLAMLLVDRGFCRVACLAAMGAANWRSRSSPSPVTVRWTRPMTPGSCKICPHGGSVGATGRWPP
jgi:hypothetical protein